MNAPRQLLLVTGSTLALALGSASHATNVIADWHTQMESAVVVTGKKSPTVAFVYFAYADIAMFDAVNSIEGDFSPLPSRLMRPAVPPRTRRRSPRRTMY